MKKLVIYYSFEGNTKFIAENIAQAIDADILELKPVNNIKSHGLMKYVWGGKQVIFGNKPQLEKFDKNPQDYDLIVFGTPIWSFTYAPALATFLDENKLTGKKVGLFCCDGGNKGKTFIKLREVVKGNEILGEIEFKEPIKGDLEKANRAKQWASLLL